MREVSRSALVPFDNQRVFNLVDDVARYCEFLPWCVDSHVNARSEQTVNATLVLATSGVRQAFTTVNHRYPHDRIVLELSEGPFSQFQGVWTFTNLGGEGCKINLDLKFELSNRLLDQTFGRVFASAADKMVAAFTEELDRQDG